jgi:hypothetical protein
MPPPIPPELVGRLQSLSAAGRDQLEQRLFGGQGLVARSRLVLLRALGAIAIGILSSGLAIALIVVVLNLIFHYGPT